MTGFENYLPATIAEMCRKFGPVLKLEGTGIDGARLLYALSGNESSFGTNCRPRFEPAYFTGRYAKNATMQELIGLYGEDAAKSYGPWQILPINAIGFSPKELATDLEKACTATVGFLNRYVFHAQKAVTLEEIADTYNSGNWKDANVPARYIADLVRNYGHGIPEKAKAATNGVIHP